MSKMVNDVDILLWINGHHAEWLDSVMWRISCPSTWIPLYVLLAGALCWRHRNWRAVLLILTGFVIAVGLSDYIASGVLKPIVARLRPTHEPAVDPLHLVRSYVGGKFGFCSSHAANTMACALLFSLLWRNKIVTASLMAWVTLICYSRIYIGAHYPTDIMAGLLVGTLLAVSVYWGLHRWVLPSVELHSPREGDEVAPQGDS